MLNCGDYPAGASTDLRAPYNKKDPELIEVEVLCSQTLSKTVTIKTDSYKTEEDENGIEHPDFSEINLEEEYFDNNHYTPYQLIDLFQKLLKNQLGEDNFIKSRGYLEHLIEECKLWCEDETVFVED